MAMLVMRIRDVRMAVAQPLVGMHMAVGPNWHGVVCVVVVPIAMVVRMLVLQWCMLVCMPMAF